MGYLDLFKLVWSRTATVFLLFSVGTASPAGSMLQTEPPRDVGWPVYGGSRAGERYSPLAQINRSTIARLEVAWTYDAGSSGGLQTQPLVIGSRLFGYTPTQTVLCLDAATGKELWRFDPGTPSGQPDRGFAYWTDGKQKVLFANALYAVWALNPEDGTPVRSFGKDGRIDLREGLGAESPGGTIALTTPGTLYKDLLILGFRTGEAAPAVHGDVRAYDVHTGALRWSFHTIPHPGEPGYDTWPKDAWKRTGGANNWTGSVVDEKRGIVYVPTGSAVNDFYGADRLGNDLYANSLLALNADTGKLLWHFQAVHHDLWDRDFPAPPVLMTIRHDGRQVDVVVQTTKHGQVFVLDRVTGKPVFPVQELPFPVSNVPGEIASPTQPISTGIEPFARQRLTADMLTTRTPEAHAAALRDFSTFVSNGQFQPFSVDRQTVVFPGFDGGAEWGGQAVDPRAGVLYVNANDVPWTGGLTAISTGSVGATAYSTNCAACHGGERKGQPPAFPSLVEATKHLSAEQMADVVHNGRGRMPGFPAIQGDTLQALLSYVRTGASEHSAGNGTATAAGRSDKQELGGSGTSPAAYRFTGYRKFLDADGYPAVQPPWGTLSALDLNTGKYLWKVPLGEYPVLAAQGMRNTGSENYGGPLATAGGLLLIGATNFDRKIRAFDSKTGLLLWESTMEFAGNATPATYAVGGKQYVVIATSNARNPKAKQGARYVAFALP